MLRGAGRNLVKMFHRSLRSDQLHLLLWVNFLSLQVLLQLQLLIGYLYLVGLGLGVGFLCGLGIVHAQYPLDHRNVNNNSDADDDQVLKGNKTPRRIICPAIWGRPILVHGLDFFLLLKYDVDELLDFLYVIRLQGLVQLEICQ